MRLRLRRALTAPALALLSSLVRALARVLAPLRARWLALLLSCVCVRDSPFESHNTVPWDDAWI